jgi:hypothetical protein
MLGPKTSLKKRNTIISSNFLTEIKLKIRNRRNLVKSEVWRLSNMLPNNQWVKEEKKWNQKMFLKPIKIENNIPKCMICTKTAQ